LHSPHPFHPLLIPLNSITGGFIILFSLCIWSPSTLFLHICLLYSSTFLQVPPTHTVPMLQSCLSLLIPMLKVVPQCIPAMNMLYFGQFSLLFYSSLPFLPTPYYLATFITYRYIHSCTEMKYFKIIDYYSLFLSLLHQVP
jgi:hypothetical protein